MDRLHVIGRKNHGKTTLVVELVEELTSRGLRVGTIKHTHHRHELDVPGKDSHRHRTAGADVVGILSPSMSAVFIPARATSESADRYRVFAPLLEQCDVVVVEGDSQTTAPKIEVWRAELGTPPLAVEDRSILAVVSDDRPAVSAPLLPRADVPRLVGWLLDHIAGRQAVRVAPRRRPAKGERPTRE
jgi:molybdopterin-guanine dinucleotide biosynthesis protein MobB